MPKFNPEEYEEKSFEPVPAGNYPFEVVDAVEDTSKAGNEMIVMELAVDVGRENPLTMKYVNLVFHKNCYFVINAFCQSTGLTDKWDAGQLDAEDCFGVSGTVKIVPGPEKDDGRQFMEVDQFVTERYAEQPKSKQGKAKQHYEDVKQTANAGGFSPADDIPF